ncbi:MAG: hypothetical protein HY579_09665 [Nitrospinae bacterium]|nr:hypothetical protein [Nitrospinota bacterium]
MKNFFLTLHMVSMCLVVGTLFVQSLSVVFRLKLKSAQEMAGIRFIQVRIHKFIYYPILAVTLVSGTVLAAKTNAFVQAHWIYPKLGLLIALVSLGAVNGAQIEKDILPKKYAMMTHIGIFIIGAAMIYLATVKPF